MADCSEGQRAKKNKENPPRRIKPLISTGAFKIESYFMKIIFLSEKFYEDFKNFEEIEQKPTRPYLRLLITLNNLKVALPFRSNIRHPYCFLTDSANHCGIDYTKAVIINKEEYIDYAKSPKIRENEFKYLLKHEAQITKRFKKYLQEYISFLKLANAPEPFKFKYTTLKYFKEELIS